MMGIRFCGLFKRDSKLKNHHQFVVRKEDGTLGNIQVFKNILFFCLSSHKRKKYVFILN